MPTDTSSERTGPATALLPEATVTQPQTPPPGVVAPPGGNGPTLPPGHPVKVGGYQILGLLGQGGMGIVYRAFDADLKRHVALKVLQGGGDVTEDELVRFRGEAELIAKLKHENIVEIYDIGQDGDWPFLVLELVEGGSFDRFTNKAPQKPRDAAGVRGCGDRTSLTDARPVSAQARPVHRPLPSPFVPGTDPRPADGPLGFGIRSLR